MGPALTKLLVYRPVAPGSAFFFQIEAREGLLGFAVTLETIYSGLHFIVPCHLTDAIDCSSHALFRTHPYTDTYCTHVHQSHPSVTYPIRAPLLPELSLIVLLLHFRGGGGIFC